MRGRVRFGGLWRHHDFLRLWAGQTISQFGSQVTILALPLTAVLVLEATPAQMGWLVALQFLPNLLLASFAGAWVDRLRRRPLLIAADLGRLVLLGSVPLAAALGRLSPLQLWIVAGLTGGLTVLYDVAWSAFLPTLIGRDDLVEGNGKLQTSAALAQIAGPGMAGGLAQAVTAPLAIVVDALSFLASATLVGLIRAPEPPPVPRADRPPLGLAIAVGLRLVLATPPLRALAAGSALANLAYAVHAAVVLVYLTRDLALAPALQGAILAVGSASGLPAALLADRIARRAGLGPTLIGTQALMGLGALLIPAAGGSGTRAIALLVAAHLLWGAARVVYTVGATSLRQTITPASLQGRVTASLRLALGTLPLGALLGGLLGERFGPRATLVIAALGLLLAALALAPLRRLAVAPAPIEMPARAP